MGKKGKHNQQGEPGPPGQSQQQQFPGSNPSAGQGRGRQAQRSVQPTPQMSGAMQSLDHSSLEAVRGAPYTQSVSLGRGRSGAPAWGPQAAIPSQQPPVSTEPPQTKPQDDGKKSKRPTEAKKEISNPDSLSIPSESIPQLPSSSLVPQPSVVSDTVQKKESESKGKGKRKSKTEKGTLTQNPPSEGKGEGQKPTSSKRLPVKETASTSAKKVVQDMLKLVPHRSIPRRKTRVIGHVPNNYDKKLRIEVNYLPVTIKNWDMEIYHYDVTFKPEAPKGLFRQAMNEMKRRHFPNRYPAFDGTKNLYAGNRLLDFGNMIRDSVRVVDPENNNREKEFDITIKLTQHATPLKFSQLARYMREGKSQEMPQDVLQATDIALRGGLFDRFLPVGRSFFSAPANIDLGGGFELWNGYFQSFIVAQNQQHAFLNIDVANKAFPVNKTVIEYLRSLPYWNESELRDGLIREHEVELREFIKGLKVEYRGGNNDRRTYRVNNLTRENAIQHRFDANGRQMSVAEYFQIEKRSPLRYPRLPLFHVGPLNRNTMIPIEFCTIVGRQIVLRKLTDEQTREMVRNAATSTTRRKERIMGNIKQANYAMDRTLTQEFGINVGGKFAEVDSVILKAPAIEYRNNSLARVNNGVWRMDRHLFLQADGLKNWAILIKDGRTRDSDMRALIDCFQRCGQNVGLPVAPPVTVKVDNDNRSVTEDRINENLIDLVKRYGNLQIVLVIMGQQRDIYSNIKRASELRCGVLTQCLKANTATRKMNPMTALNILLKINAKINGVNHRLGGPLRPVVFSKPIMFVGADVTHPAPGSYGISIAAVAASFDPSGFKYRMKYHLQPPRQEIILSLKENMVQHLEHFKRVNNRLPERIMYYRDGVSEGQFNQVLCIELHAIKLACEQVQKDYSPQITFLVVQKRHHTRFFPQPEQGDHSKNNNVLAGTVVDSDITHPTELDFYLVSHQSIQGTARPTKYHVLWDENNFNGEDLEMLTYHLCHMFARCNRSVSYPAPTYYAHLGAFRARAYWEGRLSEKDTPNLSKIQAEEGQIHGNISEMFFV